MFKGNSRAKGAALGREALSADDKEVIKKTNKICECHVRVE
jgi:hypothetical protein